MFVSTTPAELILLHGRAELRAGGRHDDLLWVSNTESDVFRMGRTGPVYYLVSGRWFSAPDFTGPWTFATPTLPADFKKIPLEHPRSRVLASVPGTQQAAEAVLLAQVPQTARVNKKELKAPEVAYQGDPKFEPIEKTTVARAVNTDKDIIKVGDLYYMCFQGVWFMAKSADRPVGGRPTSVPKEIYEIPASSPAHNVTYVTVGGRRRRLGDVRGRRGYTGMMVAWGCAVWGTGYYYPPYCGYGGVLSRTTTRTTRPTATAPGTTRGPAPTAAARSRTDRTAAPASARATTRATGTYARGAAAWGPYGARGVRRGVQPAHRHVRADAAGLERLRQLGIDRRAARRRLGAARRASPTTATGNTTRVTQGSGGGEAVTQTRAGGQRRRRAHRQRRRLRRPRRQRLPEGGRQLAFTPDLRKTKSTYELAGDAE